MSWEQLALGGVQSCTLPVYPAGMLVKPFVTDLAAQLNICLREQHV